MSLKRSLAALAFAAMCLTRPAAAQFAPDRPVRIVVPVPPGGAVDVAARIVESETVGDLEAARPRRQHHGRERQRRRRCRRARAGRRLHPPHLRADRLLYQ